MFAIKPHHGGISVPDLEASIGWYRRMLGFELESRAYIDRIPAHIAFIRCGDYRIELFQLDQAHPLPSDRREPHLDLKTHGHKHLCFAVQDAATAFHALRGKGADIVFETVIEGSPMGFVRDNSGNLLELIECPTLWSGPGAHR